MSEHAQRFPPPLLRTSRDKDGNRAPVMEYVVVECGKEASLGGVHVTCIRRKGHPIFLDHAHSNGYESWIAADDPYSEPTRENNGTDA